MDCNNQALVSIGFPRQEWWNGLAISYSRVSSLPRDQNCTSCKSSALQEDSLPLNHQGSVKTHFSSVTSSCSTLCDLIDRSTPDCPSSTPWASSNSCASSQWCHPTISSPSPPAIPFSSCLQSFPVSGKTHLDHVKTHTHTHTHTHTFGYNHLTYKMIPTF